MSYLLRILRSFITCSALMFVAAALVGCASKEGDSITATDAPTGSLRAGIPPKAELVVDTGTELKYSPTVTGRVFLYDVSADKTVSRFSMRPGQTLIVDAGSGRATIDGNEVTVGEVKAGRNYKIYFLAN